MAAKKKYFQSKKEAQEAADERNSRFENVRVFKCYKGMRRAGMYAVCSEFEWLNTY